MTDRNSDLQPGLFEPEVAGQPTYELAELERMREALERSGRYRVLRQFQRRASYSQAPAGPSSALRRGVYLDVETTGLESSDKIIELALVSFEFDDEGNIYRVLAELDEFEDPGQSIPEEITELTGITRDHVRGKRISEDRVAAIVEPADLIIAHNASFDRPYVEARLPIFEAKKWACSVSDIAWRRHGFSGRNLEYLAMKRGFVFEGHRAINDCLAGVELLAMPLPATGGLPTLADLLANSERSSMRLWAEGSPFDSKDKLKSRAYRWNCRRHPLRSSAPSRSRWSCRFRPTASSTYATKK